MLFHSGQPAEKSGEATTVAYYTLNRCPTETLQDDKTPYEMWFQKN